jgi:serine protease Do
MVLMPRHRLSPLHLGSVLLALCLASPFLCSARADTKAPAAFNKAMPENVADLKAMQTHVRALAARVIPAVVNIKIGMGQGSGVIVSADGYVLTAGHVSGTPGREAEITLADGRKVKGKTLGYNRSIDSGMIKIKGEGTWPHVAMGNSAALKKGQWCLAIGHPTGLKPGRAPVVRLGRVLDSGKALIRTDCTLVGGDSGGPLFDMDGKVIGIHSRIAGPLTANIHVPVDTYRENFERLARAEDPYIGVVGDPDSAECKILQVGPDTPAAKAGLKVNDVVVNFGGRRISDFESLRAQVQRYRPGQRVSVEVQRGDENVNLQLVIGNRPG